jgi:hypothetical protein
MMTPNLFYRKTIELINIHNDYHKYFASQTSFTHKNILI